MKISILASLLVGIPFFSLGSHIHEQFWFNPPGSIQAPGVSPDVCLHAHSLLYSILTFCIELKQQKPKLNSTIHSVAVFPKCWREYPGGNKYLLLFQEYFPCKPNPIKWCPISLEWKKVRLFRQILTRSVQLHGNSRSFFEGCFNK